MAHYDIDYSKSETKASDAINDIKDWFGNDRWEKLSPEMRKITNVVEFQFLAAFAGVKGYPVEAWYDLYHGQGSYQKALALIK